ncbi:hypothetical protein T459_26898 [Capsicum annuum]|uniref:Uncharacterized protein n=1 Tax=Capsicum annuum TaxID=4072 RepID=A0A2G2YCX7_CAPAN|nr:hypothetical protein T459_26898 [Capsicum annuum]
MEPAAASAILTKLKAITRPWEVINEWLDHMGVPREKVGYANTRQDKDRSSCELRGKNVILYTHMNIVTILPSVGVHESLFCDTLDIVRSHEEQTLVVGPQALVDPLDDEIDSPRENDLCPCSARTYNLAKGEQNDQPGIDDLDLLEYLENSSCDCLCEDDFDCGPLASRDGLYVCEDNSCEREVHDIFNSDKEGLLNFKDDTLGESESGRDLSPWLRLPFDPGLDSRSNLFQEGKDDTSHMATLIFEDMIGVGDQSSNVVGENSNVGENISTVHDINVEGLHEEPTQTDNIDVEFGVNELSDLEGAEIDLNSSADSQEINIPEDDDSEEIKLGSAGVDRGFEDIGRNKAARYIGRLGREEEYIDSSDLDSDDSRDQLKPEAVKGVDLPARRKSKKVKFDPDCVMAIFKIGMIFENVNVTTQTRA